MKRYWRYVVPAALIAVVLVVLLVTLQSNLVFFNTPTELVELTAGDDRLRLGGEVVPGTVVETGDSLQFDVTDGRVSVTVVHSGAPQDLFQEGIGVVVEGTWTGGEFTSDSMIVSHDEQYRTVDGDDYVPGVDYKAGS